MQEMALENFRVWSFFSSFLGFRLPQFVVCQLSQTRWHPGRFSFKMVLNEKIHGYFCVLYIFIDINLKRFDIQAHWEEKAKFSVSQ